VDSDATANSVTEGASVGTTVGITAAATDINGPAGSFSLIGDTSGGGFAINSGSGVVTIADAPKIDYGSAPGHAYSRTVHASHGAGGTSSAIFSIGVNNVAPVATADSYSTNEDTPLTVNAPGVLNNDSDVSGGTVTAILVTGPAHASSFNLNANGSFSYTPNANFN